MRFVAPAFALFGLLFVVPIAIHLIGRSRARVRQFAALDLLLRSEKRVARRTRVRQLLLLLLRALAIAAVPLILAKPFVEAASDLPAAVAGAQSAVIVLDDSASMSYTAGGGRLLDEAKARARRIVDALGSDADAALVLGSRGGGAPVAQLTADRARLEHAIAEVQPTERATDLSGALKRAAQILQNAARPLEARRVYLVSDLAAHGFEADPPWAAGRGPELVPVDVSDGKPLGNRAVTDLRVEPAAHLGPRGVRVSVDVGNFADEAVHELPVTLNVDGKPVAKGLLDLAAREKGTKHFFHTFSRSDDSIGVHDVTAALAPDALPDDDRRHARVEVRRDLRVLLVDGDPRNVRRSDEIFYLETALRPGDRDDSQLEVSVVTADELAAARLADYDVLFLCNVKAPLPAAPLREFVTRGGGLFVAMGDNVDPDAYNAALGDLLVQPLATVHAAPEGARLAHADRAHPHPMLASLAAAKKEDPFAEARFFRYALFRPTAEASVDDRQVVLRFADGAPALLEGRIGAGRVMVFAATLDRDWTDLPIQPIFLPLVQQATRYLARSPMHETEAPLLIGQRHDIPLADGDARLVVRLPSGHERPFERDRIAGRRALSFGDTDEPGVYRVSVAGADGALKPRPQASFVVNLDAAESDLQRITPERLARLSAGGGAGPGAARAPRRRVELWHAMGAALLLLLLGEALLLRRK